MTYHSIALVQVEELADALKVLEKMMDLGTLTNGLQRSICEYYSISNCRPLAGSGGHIPGTSEVNPKLLFPVEGLLRYLKEKHGITGDGNDTVQS